MSARRILFDLWPARLGYSGIPQTSRWDFMMLSRTDWAEVTGLLSSQFPGTRALRGELSSLDLSAERYAALLEEQAVIRPNPVRRARRLAARALSSTRREFEVDSLKGVNASSIYRRFLSKGVSYDDFVAIEPRFAWTDLDDDARFRTALSSRLSPAYLDTKGFDVALFPTVSGTRVAAQTRKLVKVHDLIPLTDSDLNAAPLSAARNWAAQMTVDARDGSWFACVSNTTRNALLERYPDLEPRTRVVPNNVPPAQVVSDSSFIATSALEDRLSQVAKLAHRSFDPGMANDMLGEYVLAVCSIEPKKNIDTLLDALEIWSSRAGHAPPRLVLVGNTGWSSLLTEQRIEDFELRGLLVHLTAVSPTKLDCLYQHARVSAFPSIVEGFGLPLIESLQRRCPLIASDIPVHREIAGDAASYFNPYDAHELADCLQAGAKLDPDLAEERCAAYSEATVVQHWHQIVDAALS